MGLARLLLGLKLEELVLERCSDILQASAFVAVASLSNLKVRLLFQKRLQPSVQCSQPALASQLPILFCSLLLACLLQ